MHLRPRPAAWYPQPHPGCWVLCPLGMPQHTEVSRRAFGLVRSAKFRVENRRSAAKSIYDPAEATPFSRPAQRSDEAGAMDSAL